MWLRRHQLHELVWAMPLRDAARHLEISDVGLSKACRQARITTPWQGYWNQLPTKRLGPGPLPARELCQHEFIRFHASSLPAELQHLVSEQAALVVWEDIEWMAARFRRRLGRVSIPALSAGRLAPSMWRLLHREAIRRRGSIHMPRFQLTWERRRLQLINGVLLAIERAGDRGEVMGEQADTLVLHIADETVVLAAEHSEASGKDVLAFRLNGHRWADEPGRPLGWRVTEMVVEIAKAAESRYRRSCPN